MRDLTHILLNPLQRSRPTHLRGSQGHTINTTERGHRDKPSTPQRGVTGTYHQYHREGSQGQTINTTQWGGEGTNHQHHTEGSQGHTINTTERGHRDIPSTPQGEGEKGHTINTTERGITGTYHHHHREGSQGHTINTTQRDRRDRQQRTINAPLVSAECGKLKEPVTSVVNVWNEEESPQEGTDQELTPTIPKNGMLRDQGGGGGRGGRKVCGGDRRSGRGGCGGSGGAPGGVLSMGGWFGFTKLSPGLSPLLTPLPSVT
uniref:Uncharacterized protein n=1 Tax=Knipowitschia caucasica TaxID=637954 RepID=A0AAV2IZ23_KNICA